MSIKKLAIITARGGSKRIPRKNIKDFLGKPIIAYSIETAINSELFDEIMVSTDDNEIASIAKEYGASIPFKRSNENSDDYSTTADVITEVLESYSSIGKSFDFVCCIYPTAPFISVDNLYTSFKKLELEQLDSVFPVAGFNYPIQRSLKIQDNKIKLVHQEHLESRSQDLEPRYHDAGQFYWIKTNQFLSKKQLFTNNSGAIILDELNVQDIDSEMDWKLAELKYKLLHGESV